MMFLNFYFFSCHVVFVSTRIWLMVDWLPLNNISFKVKQAENGYLMFCLRSFISDQLLFYPNLPRTSFGVYWTWARCCIDSYGSKRLTSVVLDMTSHSTGTQEIWHENPLNDPRKNAGFLLTTLVCGNLLKNSLPLQWLSFGVPPTHLIYLVYPIINSIINYHQLRIKFHLPI